MSAFDTILCPVDFSEASARALRYAAALAERFRARLFEGSATARVLRQTSIPTLVVPVDGSAAPSGADGSLNLAGLVLTLADPGQMSSQVLRFAADLARALGASLLVAESGRATPRRFSRGTGWDAAPSENTLRQRLFERRISHLAKRVRTERLALPGKPLMAIVTAAAQQRPGLIVVGTARGLGQQHQLSPRAAYRVICLTCLPVLVIPAETFVAIRSHHESSAPLAMVG